jgi:hypothetical protein
VQGCVYLNDLLLVGLHHRRVLLRSSSGEGGPSELVGPPVVRGDHVYLAGATLGFGSRLLRVPLHPRNGPPIAAAAPGVDVPDPLVPISSALRYGDRYLLARGLLGSQTNAVFCQETHPDLLGNTPCQLELTDPVTFPQ